MKPFSNFKIILLLFLFAINSSYAVKPATTDQAQIESVTTIPMTEVVKDSPKKSNRKSRLIEKFKKKFLERFPKNSTPKNENLETRTHGLAIASLVCGVLGIFTLGILSILAIIFAGISLKKIKSSGGFYTGRGLAIAGLVLGIVFVALFFLVLVVTS
jgi:hypothetical protein